MMEKLFELIFFLNFFLNKKNISTLNKIAKKQTKSSSVYINKKRMNIYLVTNTHTKRNETHLELLYVVHFVGRHLFWNVHTLL